jgi:hypothetical protein
MNRFVTGGEDITDEGSSVSTSDRSSFSVRVKKYILSAMVITVREAGRKRWKNVSDQDRRVLAAKAGKAAWASMSAEEKSAEMKRRAAVRAKNQKKKSRKP